MDVGKLIQQLQAEKAAIEAAIADLEALRGPDTTPPKRRGRKSMGDGERAEVSERMKKYWASRREEEEKRQSERDAHGNNGNQSASLTLKNHSQ